MLLAIGGSSCCVMLLLLKVHHFSRTLREIGRHVADTSIEVTGEHATRLQGMLPRTN
jgi:hypothetical protein